MLVRGRARGTVERLGVDDEPLSLSGENVVDVGTEARALGDVMRPTRKGVLGHRAGLRDVSRTTVEFGDVLLENAVPIRCALIEEHANLLERHPRRLVPEHDGDPHQVVVAESASPRGVARGVEEPFVLPVPQDVSLETEPRRGIADGLTV